MNIALLLAGGTGSRFGSEIPKQFLRIHNAMLVTWTIRALCRSGNIDALQIVASEGWHDAIRSELPPNCVVYGFSSPGETRQGSIRNGLRDIALHSSPQDTVLVHDAARPFISQELIDSCFAALPGHDGVMPVLPVTDTIYFSESGDRVERLLPRDALFAGQAPELFRIEPYLEANEKLTPEQFQKINGTSEPAVLAGLDVALIPGSRRNIKITTWEDWDVCRENLGKTEQ